MRSLEQCGGHPRSGISGLETAIQEMEAQPADGHPRTAYFSVGDNQDLFWLPFDSQLSIATAFDALAERYHTMRPGDVIDEALVMFRGYHTRPVVERVSERLIARDLRLLFYYQNRTAHIGPGVWS